jgi:hypothetical protein
MRFQNRRLRIVRSAVALVAFFSLSMGLRAQQPSVGAGRVVGTIQSISGKSLTVISDDGVSSNVRVEDATRLLQIEPGKTDLKEATPLTFPELQTGDRVLVRGTLAEDGKTIRAASVVAVKKAALAEKQARDRSEWRRGVGGLVKSVDPSASTILLTTNSLGTNKEVIVHFTKDTVLRRYAADSTRFDAAKLAPLPEIQPGDQLRAKGARSESGTEFNAVEIVSGTFRSIAGTISSSDAATNTLVVQDLASKTAVTLKVSLESQMRTLPPQFAEGLAERLRNQSGGTAQYPTSPVPQSSVPPQAAPNPQQGSTAGAPQVGRGVGGDFQQMIARLPVATFADLQKGEAIMVVTTRGNGKDPLTVITLLGGVEPILRASPKGSQNMILSPWSLGGGEPSGN